MAELGRVPLDGEVTTVQYEQGVGPMSADFHVIDGRLDHIMIDTCPPLFLSVLPDAAELARGLGVNAGEITGTNLPVQVVSTGMPQLMVPMQSLAAVQRLDASEMSLPSLSRVLRSLGSNFIMVFTTETGRSDVTTHVRGFGHFVGIPEDPVTGNANGALGAYLVRNGVIPLGEPTIRYISEQGSEVQRPGTVIVEVEHEHGTPRKVRVGGPVVQVIRGTFTI
jgi:PhzF family phenazine biosynthesis protein